MLNLPQPLAGVVQKKVPLYFVLLAALIPTGFLLKSRYHDLQRKTPNDAASAIMPTVNCDQFMEQYRLQTFELTKPLLLTDVPNEDPDMAELKGSLTEYISQAKMRSEANEVAVYLRELNNGSWTSINSSHQFAPGSMLKIPILITYFKMLEKSPGLFDRELHLTSKMIPNKTQYIDPTHITPGKYKIRDLIEAMITKSDNYATVLLNLHIDQAIFEKLFTDIGLKKPDIKASSYPLGVKEIGRFMRVLYSSTYLNPVNSEKALELLTRSQYKNGILAGLPQEVKVAHKFGESGDGTIFELHETAIVYHNQSPYLLVIMTKGNDISRLPGILSGISKKVYEHHTRISS